MTLIASQADRAAALPPHLLRFEESSAGTRLFWMHPEAALPLSPLGLLSGHQGWPCYAACVGPQNANNRAMSLPRRRQLRRAMQRIVCYQTWWLAQPSEIAAWVANASRHGAGLLTDPRAGKRWGPAKRMARFDDGMSQRSSQGAHPVIRVRAKAAMTWDILIRGGFLIDGSGSPGTLSDIALAAGRIAAIDSSLSGKASKVIDAEGLAVAPGFIDIKTHSDFVLPINPKAESKVR